MTDLTPDLTPDWAHPLPPHDSRDPDFLHLAHTALCADEAQWRRCAFVGLRIGGDVLYEARQCPQCPSVILRPCQFVEAARALAGRLANLPVPLSLSQAAQTMAEWAARQQPRAEDANATTLPCCTVETEVIRIPMGTTLKEAERRLIQAALACCEGSRSETARTLGLSRRTLYNKLASLRRRQLPVEVPPPDHRKRTQL
jgi:hypothetical protein